MKINRKEYMKEMYSRYKKTKEGLISIIYSSLRGNSRKRGMELPLFTKQEFRQWIISQPNFDILFTEWVNSNYDNKLRPSIDRLNDYIGYQFDNMIVTTWGENKLKGHKDRRLGINNKVNISVTQIDIDSGDNIATYHSLMEAQRQTGILAGNIWNAVFGKSKTAGGFKWVR